MNGNTQNRRDFLTNVGVATLGIAVSGTLSAEAATGKQGLAVNATQTNLRAIECARLRRNAAQDNFKASMPEIGHPSNGDEDLYPDHIANYSKGLRHNSDGTVDADSYNSMLVALASEDPREFNAIVLGGDRRLANPQSGLAFDMEGADGHSFAIPPAPNFASREQAAEMAEDYWMAFLRDVPFARYDTDPIAHAAAADLSHFGTDFKGAKSGGDVTPATLFRGLTPGDKAGPYLSQFFCQPCGFGANKVSQKIRSASPNVDFMMSFDTGPGNWLDVQRGISPPFDNLIDPTPRYMRTGRDIGHWVHMDVLFQAYLQAFLILAGANAPVDDANPYADNPTQDGFGTFGEPHIATLLCEVANRALKAVWFQKWFVHRRLRPEVFGARIDRTLYHRAGYPIDPEILTSLSSASRLGGYIPSGNALLPMAFPEGSPTHPSYGAGHATVAGACVTILKAWFKESAKLTDLGLITLQPTDDGLNLVPYNGADAGNLTVGGELNKLASNVAIGRNIAGVHWRSDATESLRLGEKVALSILQDYQHTYNENFHGFSLTRFDEESVTV